MSPSIPQPSIVEDESDYDLNEDRKILANIRKERAESWQLDDAVNHPNNRANYNIAITNMNHFGSNEADLQSLAQGGGDPMDPDGTLSAMFNKVGSNKRNKSLEKMILTTTSSIFQHMV